jgi:hypothetical protein
MPLARTEGLEPSTAHAEVQILKDLRYRINVGLDYRQEQGDSYNGPNTFKCNIHIILPGQRNVRNGEAWSYVIENLLYYDKTIKRT